MRPPRLGMALRAWRRNARILAFASILIVTERLGLDMVLVVIAIVMSLAPDLSGAYALAGFGFAAAVLHALGAAGHARFGVPTAGRAEATLTALALGAAAWWLIARHWRIGPPPRARTPAVLGWIIFSFILLALLPDLFGLTWDHSPLALHGCARSLLGLAPSLIALAALLASRARPKVRRLAVAPAILVLLALVPGSSWYLNHVALADVPEVGPRLTIADPTPARVVRSAHIGTRGDAPLVSPGGRAFVLQDFKARGWLPDANPARPVLHAGDFDGHIVEVDGTAAAFVDDERLIVLRPRADPKAEDQIVEVRPFAGGEPVWTKSIAGADVRAMSLRIDGDAGKVFIVANGSLRDGAPLFWQTTAAPESTVEAGPLRQHDNDFVVVAAPGVPDGGGALVARAQRFNSSGQLFWRTAEGQRLLAAQRLRLDCVDPFPGAAQIWCLTREAPILMEIAVAEPRMTRVPGEIRGWEPKMIGKSTMAMLVDNQLQVLDLEARHGARLTLPEASSRASLHHLASGGLAAVERAVRGGDATLTVYEMPAGFR